MVLDQGTGVLALLCSLVLGPHPANCLLQFEHLEDVWVLSFPLTNCTLLSAFLNTFR